MNAIPINEEVIQFIKNQALLSEEEIYGWLIGFHDYKNTSYVLNALECQNYLYQSNVQVIPDPLEIQKISNLMPYGIGIVGIFHSHPKGSGIFHSHIDDQTLVSLGKQIPSCVSIVTNGVDLNFYQFNNQNLLTEVDYMIIKSTKLNFIPISFNNTFIVSIDSVLLNNKNLHLKLLNKFKEFLEENWYLFELTINNSKISYSKKIYQYLNSEFQNKEIELKFTSFNKNGAINVSLINEVQSDNLLELKLHLYSKDLFYITDDKNSFEELKDIIKNKIVNNSLMPMINFSIVDVETMEILIPQNYFLKFLDFYIKATFYHKDINENILRDYSINQNYENLKKKNQDMLNRLYKIISSYASIQLEKSVKKKLLRFINDFAVLVNSQESNELFKIKLEEILYKLKAK